MGVASRGRVPGQGIRWGLPLGVCRCLAWAALLGVTGLLVHGEVDRPALPRGVAASTDLVYRREGGRRARLDLYVPREPPPTGGRPAVLVLHGGGWRGGSKRDCRPMAVALVERGYVVVAADYALSRPGAPSWPANIEDVRAALRWLYDHATLHGVNPRRIAVLGVSAGGHLAALLATCPGSPGPGAESDAPGPPRATGPEAAPVRVQAVIDFYGPADLTTFFEESPHARGSLSLFLGGSPREFPGRYRPASPVAHVSRDTPPMLLIHGTDDRLVPPTQSLRLAAALEAEGVPHRLIQVAGARHGFEFRAGARDLLPDVLAFLESAWNVNPEATAR